MVKKKSTVNHKTKRYCLTPLVMFKILFSLTLFHPFKNRLYVGFLEDIV